MQSSPAHSPQFSVNVETKENATIVRCSGRLVIQNGSILRQAVHDRIQPGAHIVLDLTDVTHCDSMGLGTVISLYVSSRTTGCRLQVINFSQKIRQLFSMANVLSVFEAGADGISHIR